MNKNDTNVPDRVRLYQFYMWVASPTGVYSLRAVLEELRDVELLHIMQESTSVHARSIVWAEYGRRHKLADIEFAMASIDVLSVHVTNLVAATGFASA